MGANDPSQRRHDPGRRDRIIDACLDVIAEFGVAGTSHRRVAEVADVPLGSMSYHFTGMHELLHEAFLRYAEQAAADFDERMAAATDVASARLLLTDHISSGLFSDQRELVLTHELYTLAARDACYRDICNAWMRRSRRTLERWFDPVTARILDAFIEGLSIHRALDSVPQERAVVVCAVDRIIGTAVKAAAG